MKITTDITRQDYYDYVKFHFFKTKLKRTIIIGVISMVAILLYINMDEFSLSGTISFSLSFILFYFFALKVSLNKAKKLPEKNGTILGVKEYEFGEEKIAVKTSKSESNFDWSCVIKMEENSKALYLYTDENMAILLPKRFFNNNLEVEDFKTLVKQRLNII